MVVYKSISSSRIQKLLLIPYDAFVRHSMGVKDVRLAACGGPAPHSSKEHIQRSVFISSFFAAKPNTED